MRSRLIALAVFSILAIVLWCLGQPNSITQGNCDQIQAGMSETQVERILGCRGVRIDIADRQDLKRFYEITMLGPEPLEGTVRAWLRRSGEIYVVFDATSRVVTARYWQVDWDGDVFCILGRAVGYWR